MRASYLVPVAALLLTACGTSVDPEATLDTIRMTEQAQLEAIAADDIGGATRLYQEDAVMIAPGSAPVEGAEAIRAQFETLLADENLALETTAGPGWAATSGDLAVTTFTGTLTMTDAASGEPVTVPIGNQTVWRKADGATWQIVSDNTYALPAAQADAAAGT